MTDYERMVRGEPIEQHYLRKNMIQFSVGVGDEFPGKAFEFLSKFECRYNWYYLFEPNLLVRIDTQNEAILEKAEALAKSMNMEYQEGDVAESSPSGCNGKYFYGEAGTYGVNINRCNEDFLYASTKLILTIDKENKRHFGLIRKHIHLFCNQCSMNYWKEGWFCLRMAINSFRLGMKYGRR